MVPSYIVMPASAYVIAAHGAGGMPTDDSEAYIAQLYCPVSHRRQGFARRVMELVIADADKEGITLWLFCCADRDEDNQWLMRFYRSLGFRRSFGDWMLRKPIARRRGA